jgi:predicted RNase H-like nuclease
VIFVGIDLAWTYKNETGLCIMNDQGRVLYLDAQVYTDAQIADLILTYEDQDLCIAVDAPLVIRNESGSREADRLLTRTRIHGHHLKLFMANRAFFMKAYGTVRGEALAKCVKNAALTSYEKEIEFGFLAQKGHSIMVETFPTGICCGLFPDIYPIRYKVKGKVAYSETNTALHTILSRVCQFEEDGLISGVRPHFEFTTGLIKRKAHKHIEDKLDAFLSAYGLYSIYKNTAEPLCFGDLENGFITIPIKR